VGAEVARQIEELEGGKVGGGNALEDLLVGRIGRLGGRPSPPISGLIVDPSMMSSA
jgi:hypothetical protein